MKIIKIIRYGNSYDNVACSTFSLMRLQRKITHALLSLRVFVLTEWEIAVDNFLELRNMILPEDK